MARELAGIFPSRCKSEKKNPQRGCRQEYRVKLQDELTTAVELRAGDVTGWKRGRKGRAASGDYVEFIAHNAGPTPGASNGLTENLETPKGLCSKSVWKRGRKGKAAKLRAG